MPHRLFCAEIDLAQRWVSTPRWIAVCVLSVAICGVPNAIRADSVSDQLATLRSVRSNDEAVQKNAAAAVQQLADAKDLKLIEVLKSMNGATPIGKNWLMGIANTLYGRTQADGQIQAVSRQELEGFFADQTQDSEARYTVFRWLTDNDPELRAKLLEGMLLDTSLELRFDAIAQALAASESLPTDRLQELLDAARHPEHVASIVGRLEKSGIKVDQAKHMGFLTQWKLIGLFDNVGSNKFDVVYDLETDWAKGAEAQSYEGKSGQVEWMEHTTDSADGQVNIAKLYNNEKGCVVYAATQINSPSPLDCELRVGCINAQKVWVNGELVLANEVYHTGTQIDQYSVPIRLKSGANRILVKVYQNEQKEAWAQDYSFQLRLCDATGKAVLNKE